MARVVLLVLPQLVVVLLRYLSFADDVVCVDGVVIDQHWYDHHYQEDDDSNRRLFCCDSVQLKLWRPVDYVEHGIL